MIHPETRFLSALVFAVITETIVLLLVRSQLPSLHGVGCVQTIYAGLMANVSSLPYLWFLLPGFFPNYILYSVVGEVAVFLWEGLFYLMYLRVAAKAALLLSFAANLASFLLGFFIFS